MRDTRRRTTTRCGRRHQGVRSSRLTYVSHSSDVDRDAHSHDMLFREKFSRKTRADHSYLHSTSDRSNRSPCSVPECVARWRPTAAGVRDRDGGSEGRKRSVLAARTTSSVKGSVQRREETNYPRLVVGSSNAFPEHHDNGQDQRFTHFFQQTRVFRTARGRNEERRIFRTGRTCKDKRCSPGRRRQRGSLLVRTRGDNGSLLLLVIEARSSVEISVFARERRSSRLIEADGGGVVSRWNSSLLRRKNSAVTSRLLLSVKRLLGVRKDGELSEVRPAPAFSDSSVIGERSSCRTERSWVGSSGLDEVSKTRGGKRVAVG